MYFLHTQKTMFLNVGWKQNFSQHLYFLLQYFEKKMVYLMLLISSDENLNLYNISRKPLPLYNEKTCLTRFGLGISQRLDINLRK